MMEVMVTDPPEGMKYEESCTSLAHFRDARRFSERLTNYIPREGMKYEESCTSLAHLRDARRLSKRLTNYTPPGGDEV